jgi:hypothetical protein
MSMTLLTARWSNLCLLTYAVPPALLESRVPPGLALEVRDGRAFVSLVAFEFHHTRVLGVPWPGYTEFPEVNLRFYVRHGDDRGVVFVKEFVPQGLVAFLARSVYGEPYKAAPMRSKVATSAGGEVSVEYRVRFGGRTNRLKVVGHGPCTTPDCHSVDHFFKEHRWGFGTRHGRAIQYEVEHPTWACYHVDRHELDWDWGRVYGPDFAGLADVEPCSVLLAVGSPVSVHSKGRVTDEVPAALDARPAPGAFGTVQ